MIKWFKASVAVLAITLLASGSFAFSPTWSTVPDVMIGDCEEAGWFIFSNAFNFSDYVSDEDTPTTGLRIVFAEGAYSEPRSGATPDYPAVLVEVNGKDEIDFTAKDVEALVGSPDFNDIAKVLNSSDSSFLGDVDTASFEALSSSADRAMWLIASDLTTTPGASSAFRVRSSAGACDEISFPFACTTDETWTTDGEFAEWGEFGFVIGGPGSPPASGTGGGAITLTGSTTTQLALGQWELQGANAIPYQSNKLYRARFSIASSNTDPLVNPALRMRVFPGVGQPVDATLLIADGNNPASLQPSLTAKEYRLYHEPSANATGDLQLGFDMFDNSAAKTGTFTCDEVSIDSCNVPDGFTTIYTHDAGGDEEFSDWLTILNFRPFSTSASVITISKTAGSILCTQPAISGGAESIALIESPTGVTIGTDKVYRIQYTINSTSAKADIPQQRLRQAIGLSGLMKVIQPLGTAADHMPPGTYNVYVASKNVEGANMNAGWDILHLDTSQGASNITLESVVIGEMDDAM